MTIENYWWINTRNRFKISYERLKFGEEPAEDKLDEHHFGNNPNENYTLANPGYHDKTGWLIGDIKTTHTISYLWEYQLSNILELVLRASHKWGISEYGNSYSIQVNIDY